ncbi:right-handed parallel beta-helix repeat-containing protein [Methylolobus aquaticus]
MNLLRKLARSIVILLLSAAASEAADYFVSPAGDDLNPGTARTQAWRTIGRVNQAVFGPGDRVLFEGGRIFFGSLYFDPSDQGTAASPIGVASYGVGRASIHSGANFGFFAHNVGGYVLRNIDFVGDGPALNSDSGIVFYNDRPDRRRLDYLRVDRVAVTGYGQYGLLIAALNKSGYRNVRVSNVDAHHNALAGIMVSGHFSTSLPGYAHQNIRIDHCRVWQNSGRAGLSSHSGSGIIMSDVDNGLIEYSVAYENGALNSANGGPIGIWAWDANRIVIQHNESHHNRTSSRTDGGGFDLDGGMTRSVMQYNYSHDNDGAGFLLAQFPTARPFSGNTIRYNISQNDARKNSFGAIHVWNGGSGIERCEIHNNMVYVSPAPSGTPRAVYFQTSARDLHVRNNILITTGGLRLVDAVVGQTGVLFQGNDYWSSGGNFRVRWEGAEYWALTNWRGTTGQEMLGGGPVGYRIDPRLVNAGGGGTLNDATLLPSLSAYRLQAGSLLIDSGLDLPVLFGLDDGRRDFHGTALPQGGRVDIGAHEATSR